MQRNDQKFEEEMAGKKSASFLFLKAFDIGTLVLLQKAFHGVFELPLLKNAQKRNKEKT
jgi:hypothetical protein